MEEAMKRRYQYATLSEHDAHRLYQQGGATAVYEAVNLLPPSEWADCHNCDANVPVTTERACLLCGHDCNQQEETK
jgi:hypothetical protein